MRGAVHMQISTIGLDIAKNVFQVHGISTLPGRHRGVRHGPLLGA